MNEIELGVDCCGDRYPCLTTIRCKCGCNFCYCTSCYQDHCCKIVHNLYEKSQKSSNKFPKKVVMHLYLEIANEHDLDCIMHDLKPLGYKIEDIVDYEDRQTWDAVRRTGV